MANKFYDNVQERADFEKFFNQLPSEDKRYFSLDPNVISIDAPTTGQPKTIQQRMTEPKKSSTNFRRPGLGSIESVDPILEAQKEQAKATQDVAAATQEQTNYMKNSSLYMAGAKFALDVLNANSAYRGMDMAAQLNIQESRRLANDAIERAKQRALEARTEGMLEGEKAMLSLAAQGQDVQSMNVQRVKGSLEDIALYNGMQEEINGVREALGYELEEVMINYQLDQAAIDRDMQIFSSGLNLAVTGMGAL